MKMEGFSLMSSNKGFCFLFFSFCWCDWNAGKWNHFLHLSESGHIWLWPEWWKMRVLLLILLVKKKNCQYQKSKRVKIKKGDYFERLANSKTVPTFVQYSSSSWIERFGFWLGAMLESTTTTTISSPLHSLILLEYRPNTFLSPLFPSLAYFLENVPIH